jgi:hypothetical protein
VKTHTLLAALSLLVTTACGGAAYHMRTSREPSPPDAIEGSAIVVFVMPGDGRDVITIANEHGELVGELRGRSWFPATTTPGDHRFYAFSGSSAYLVRATALEAGRVYYVEMVDPLLGSSRFLARGCVAATLGAAHRTELDPAFTELALRRQVGNIPQRMLEADHELERMGEADQAARTLSGSCQ